VKASENARDFRFVCTRNRVSAAEGHAPTRLTNECWKAMGAHSVDGTPDLLNEYRRSTKDHVKVESEPVPDVASSLTRWNSHGHCPRNLWASVERLARLTVTKPVRCQRRCELEHGFEVIRGCVSGDDANEQRKSVRDNVIPMPRKR
jgi:hypothetical protein